MSEPSRPISTDHQAVVHDLKTLPHFFAALVDDTKPFEIRKNDRNYKVGDKLLLREWHADTEQYTGREVGRVVTYITAFAQMPGWVVMGVRKPLDPIGDKLRSLPILGTLYIDDPHDPRNKELKL